MWLFVVFIECYLLLRGKVPPCTIAAHLYVDLFPDSPLTEYISEPTVVGRNQICTFL